MLNSLKGWLGEKLASFGLWLNLDPRIYRRVHSVLVPSRNGTTQVDHIILSAFGIFVVEDKNFSGWIFGSEHDANWCQSIYGKKSRFQNPLRQNYRHIKCLSEFLKLPESCFHSVVFLGGECELKTELPPNVLVGGLSSYVSKFQTTILTPQQVATAEAALLHLKANPPATASGHIASLRERHSSETVCPRCGAPLKRKIAKKGLRAGQPFLGCQRFPDCKYIKNIG